MEDSHSHLYPLALSIASEQADQLEVKHGLPLPRKQYVENKAQAIFESLELEFSHLKTLMKKTSVVLEAELNRLPLEEQVQYQREFLDAMDKLEEEPDEQLWIAESQQVFLGLTHPTLLWMYKVGYHSFQEAQFEKAEGIFLLLVLLNGAVRDYWMALGFAQEALALHSKALLSFSFASLLDPEYAASRCQSAKSYLHLEQFDDALIELGVLAEILQKQKLDSMRSELELLQGKARNKQKL